MLLSFLPDLISSNDTKDFGWRTKIVKRNSFTTSVVNLLYPFHFLREKHEHVFSLFEQILILIEMYKRDTWF